MVIFIISSRDPRKKSNDPHKGRDPRLKTILGNCPNRYDDMLNQNKHGELNKRKNKIFCLG